MVAVFAPERRGGTNEIAVRDTAVHTNRSAGRALQRRRATAMTMPTTEKKPVTTANPDNGIVSPPSGTSKSTPMARALDCCTFCCTDPKVQPPSGGKRAVTDMT